MAAAANARSQRVRVIAGPSGRLGLAAERVLGLGVRLRYEPRGQLTIAIAADAWLTSPATT